MNSYIHIPFCNQKCSYCKFALTPIYDDLKKKKYIAALKSEIRKKFEKHNFPSIETIYFGGGTPSVLKISEVTDILSAFPDGDKEISFECNPENVNTEYLHGLFTLGINRISIGVQSLNDSSLKIIERKSSENIFSALDSVKKFQVWNFILFWNKKISVNVDFILWLPEVKNGEILQNIKYLHDKYNFITHTSVYILEKWLYPKSWREKTINDKEIHEEYGKICTYFSEKYWNHYEVSNFAKPGFECKHNMGYWKHTSTFGFGLSAAEYREEDGKYIRENNSSSFSWYYKNTIEFYEELTEEQKNLEKFLFGLRTTGFINYKNTLFLDFEAIKNFEKDGIILTENNTLRIHEKYFPILDHITEKIII